MKPEIKLNDGDEFEVFSKTYRRICGPTRPGVLKKIKRRYNKRVRRVVKRELQDAA